MDFPSLKQRLSQFRRQKAYHHKAAEWVLLFLFVSGVLIWNRLDVPWPVFRWSLSLHMVLGLIVFPLTTGLFWWGHRTLLLRSNKSFLRITGRFVEIALLICFITGLFLFFFGTTGDMTSQLVNWAHWGSGLVLGPLVVRHGWRFSVLRWQQLKRIPMALFRAPTLLFPKNQTKAESEQGTAS